MSVEKGKRYEREIARKLSEWSGLELVRTPDGAPEELYADVWPKLTSEHFPLAVECKHHEDWSFDQIVNGVGPFFGWLRQAEEQAMSALVTLGQWYDPMLVFTKNRFPDMVAVHYRTMADMLHRSAASRTWWVDPLDYATRGVENATIPVLLLAVKDEGRGGRYVVMLLEQFLMTISYEELLHYLTNIYWTI